MELYEIIKKALKDGLTEWVQENNTENFAQIIPNRQCLLTCEQFITKYPFVTRGGIRHRLFHREVNGFDKCICTIGAKILIKEKEALEWFSNPPPNATCIRNKESLDIE